MKTEVAIVTGGIKGCGKEIVGQLVAQKVHVVTNYRKDTATAQQFETEMKKVGANVYTLQADMGNTDDVSRLFDFVKEKYYGGKPQVHEN